RRQFLKGSALGAAGLAGTALVGCGDDDDGDSDPTPGGWDGSATPEASATQSSGARVPEGSITAAMPALGSQSMNPFFQPTGSDTPIAAHLWEGLYKSDTDAQPVPALATSFEIVNRSTYV